GYWSITASEEEAVPNGLQQHYHPDAAILETTIGLPVGELAVTDFMATAHLRGEPDALPAPCLIRQIAALTLPCQFALRLKVAPDYGRQLPRITYNPEGIIAVGAQGTLVVSYVAGGTCGDFLDNTAYGPVATVHTLQPGECMTLALSWAANPHQASRLRRELLRRDWGSEKEATAAYWQGWSAQTLLDSPYRDLLVRNAITLKLLTFAPTGAFVAAPTTSLPEQIGGTRNWDYRYCWIRDGSMSATALALLGHVDEALAFVKWVEHRERQSEGELRVLYGIQGERETPEAEVPPLEGYQQSTPVRIGNQAVAQQQHDLYGEWLDCVAHIYLRPDASVPDRWLASLVDAAVTHTCDFWMEPDAGIWEVRSQPQNFVHSKMLCWIAVDRGIKLAEHFH